MIKTLEDYNIFLKDLNHQKDDKYLPGEHHFVATFLIPKIYCLTGLIPDYVNPDGMKNIPGDIIYEYNTDSQISIEVKYDKISFSTNQREMLNNYSDSKKNNFPNYLIAFIEGKILFIEWKNLKKENSNLSSKTISHIKKQITSGIQEYSEEQELELNQKIIDIFKGKCITK